MTLFIWSAILSAISSFVMVCIPIWLVVYVGELNAPLPPMWSVVSSLSERLRERVSLPSRLVNNLVTKVANNKTMKAPNTPAHIVYVVYKEEQAPQPCH